MYIHIPQGSKYPIIIYDTLQNPNYYNLHNYYPKTEYLIIGSFIYIYVLYIHTCMYLARRISEL